MYSVRRRVCSAAKTFISHLQKTCNQILLHKSWWRELSQYHDWLIDLQKMYFIIQESINYEGFFQNIDDLSLYSTSLHSGYSTGYSSLLHCKQKSACNSVTLLKLQQTKQKVTPHPHGTANLRESLFDLRMCWRYQQLLELNLILFIILTS